jgi:hypothetical protein
MDSLQTWMGSKNYHNRFDYNFVIHLDTSRNGFVGKTSLVTPGNYKVQLKKSNLYIKLKVVENVSKYWKKDKYDYQVILDRNKLILIKQK